MRLFKSKEISTQLRKNLISLWSEALIQRLVYLGTYQLAGLAVFIVYLVFIRWKKGLKAFVLSVFGVGLIPAFWASYAHFPFVEPFIEPHWFYFSSLGFFLFLA